MGQKTPRDFGFGKKKEATAGSSANSVPTKGAKKAAVQRKINDSTTKTTAAK